MIKCHVCQSELESKEYSLEMKTGEKLYFCSHSHLADLECNLYDQGLVEIEDAKIEYIPDETLYCELMEAVKEDPLQGRIVLEIYEELKALKEIGWTNEQLIEHLSNFYIVEVDPSEATL